MAGDGKGRRMMKKGSRGKRQGARENPRRLFVFGPGIMVALIIATFVVAKNYVIPEKPPVAEKQVSGIQTPGIMPEIAFILDKKQALNLTAAQKNSLKRFYGKFNADAKPLKETLKNSSASVSSFLNEKQESKKKTSLKEIHEQAQDLQKFSKELSDLRTFYWQQAMNVLSENQRKKVTNEIKKSKDIYRYVWMEP